VKLLWTAGARQELAEIISYIWSENPSAAKRMRDRIQTTVAAVGSQPFMGRPGAILGTREAIPHPRYRIVYQIDDEAVIILSVVHTSRQWPPVDEEGDS